MPKSGFSGEEYFFLDSVNLPSSRQHFLCVRSAGDVVCLRAYDLGMRYAQRGGYTPAEQQRRERLRLEAAGRFAGGDKISEIAHDLQWLRVYRLIDGWLAGTGPTIEPW